MKHTKWTCDRCQDSVTADGLPFEWLEYQDGPSRFHLCSLCRIQATRILLTFTHAERDSRVGA